MNLRIQAVVETWSARRANFFCDLAIAALSVRRSFTPEAASALRLKACWRIPVIIVL
jgi:hypothetical protein